MHSLHHVGLLLIYTSSCTLILVFLKPAVHTVTVIGSVRVTNPLVLWLQLSQRTWAFSSLCLKYRLSAELLAQKIPAFSRFDMGSHKRPQKGTLVKSEPESDLQGYSAHTITFRQLCDCGFQFQHQCAVILFNDTSSTTRPHLKTPKQ